MDVMSEMNESTGAKTVLAHEWLLARMRDLASARGLGTKTGSARISVYRDMLLGITIPVLHDELVAAFAALAEQVDMHASAMKVAEKLRAEKERFAAKVAEPRFETVETTFGQLKVHDEYLGNDGLHCMKVSAREGFRGLALEGDAAGCTFNEKDSTVVQKIVKPAA